MVPLDFKFLVVGADGQLGTDIVKVLEARGLPFTKTRHQGPYGVEFDIANPRHVHEAFTGHRVDASTVVINCTGYCNVVKAEKDDRAEAYDVNAIGVAHLAKECVRTGAKLIHFSTDYVFSGELAFPHMECSYTAPLNHYGRSKLMGEQLIQQLMDENYVIIRTNSLYGHKPTRTKGNFPTNMLAKYHKGEVIEVADNIVSTPTYTLELAEATIDVAQQLPNAPKIINITNKGESSWYDFALEVFAQYGITDAKVVPVQAHAGEVPQRPLYTVLDSRRYDSMGLYKMSHWKDAFTKYINQP